MEGEIRIYVACLASYNSGMLFGQWIDATQAPEDIRVEIEAMLKRSPIESAEEYAIHDYESFDGAPISEYEGIEEVSRKANFVLEHGRLGGELIAYFGGDVEEAEAAMEDQYRGQYSSLADFAGELTEETIVIPEALRYYIDYDAMARDLAINDVFTIEPALGVVHVFWSH